MPAAAHAHLPLAEAALTSWSLDSLVLVPLVACHSLYVRGLLALRRRIRRAPAAFPTWRVLSFLIGELVLALALLSPLDAMTATLVSAHMAQHFLLVAVAPPLLLLGRPAIACFRGLPEAAQRGLMRNGLARAAIGGWNQASRPIPAALIHGAALWFWHVPLVFDAAVASEVIHVVAHLSLFGTAMLFWQSLLASVRSPATAPAGVGAALFTLIHCGLLGALITLAGMPLYAVSERAIPWGLSALEDQQLAGLIMWVVQGATYLVAGLVTAARLLDGPFEPAAAGAAALTNSKPG